VKGCFFLFPDPSVPVSRAYSLGWKPKKFVPGKTDGNRAVTALPTPRIVSRRREIRLPGLSTLDPARSYESACPTIPSVAPFACGLGLLKNRKATAGNWACHLFPKSGKQQSPSLFSDPGDEQHTLRGGHCHASATEMIVLRREDDHESPALPSANQKLFFLSIAFRGRGKEYKTAAKIFIPHRGLEWDGADPRTRGGALSCRAWRCYVIKPFANHPCNRQPEPAGKEQVPLLT